MKESTIKALLWHRKGQGITEKEILWFHKDRKSFPLENKCKESLMAVLRTTSSMMTTVHHTLVLFVYNNTKPLWISSKKAAVHVRNRGCWCSCNPFSFFHRDWVGVKYTLIWVQFRLFQMKKVISPPGTVAFCSGKTWPHALSQTRKELPRKREGPVASLDTSWRSFFKSTQKKRWTY